MPGWKQIPNFKEQIRKSDIKFQARYAFDTLAYTSVPSWKILLAQREG